MGSLQMAPVHLVECESRSVFYFNFMSTKQLYFETIWPLMVRDFQTIFSKAFKWFQGAQNGLWGVTIHHCSTGLL